MGKKTAFDEWFEKVKGEFGVRLLQLKDVPVSDPAYRELFRTVAATAWQRCEEQAKPKETFQSKLRQMRLDLISIVDRMNKDRSYDAAAMAQVAVVAVAKVEDKIDAMFSGNKIEWDWQPEEDYDDDQDD